MVKGSSPTSRPDRVVVVPVANMFSAPNENSDVTSQAIIGSNVVTLDVRGNWVRVRTDDDSTRAGCHAMFSET